MSIIVCFKQPKNISSKWFSISGKTCSTNSTNQEKKKGLADFGILEIQPKNKTHVPLKCGPQTDEPIIMKEKTVTTAGAPFDENVKHRTNALSIQMLSESLHQQIFQGIRQKPPDTKVIEKAKLELQQHGLCKDKINYLKDVSVNIPPLKGKNIEEHFWILGEEQCKAYRELVNSFIKKGVPSTPSKWLCQKGWTKYVNGEEPVAVAFPDDDAFVFDVEVNVKLGELPTLATAVSSNAWYGWVCSDLAEGVDSIPTNWYKTNMLIPFEGKTISQDRPRIIVGHNVSYDRARIKEQYYLKNSALRFLDTMSLHICIGGLTKTQKARMKKKTEDFENNFGKEACLCSLKDVYNLYCNKELEKEARDVFMTGLMSDVRKDFQNLMNYCANDVKATYEVLQAIFPVFLQRFSHPVTLAGMLQMGSAFLPVNNNWSKFLTEADQTYEDLKSELSSILSKKCDSACRLLKNEEYKRDLWMWSEDWTTQELKLTKRKLTPKISQTESENAEECEKRSQEEEEEENEEEKRLMSKYQHLFDQGKLLPKRLPFLPGYPLWYRKLCKISDSPGWTLSPQLSTAKFITPKLLKLSWENFPLHHTPEHGWGILIPDFFAEDVETAIPFEKLKELTIKNCNVDLVKLKESMSGKISEKNAATAVPFYQGAGVWCNHIIDNCCFFLKIPHKDGTSKNVGTPLSKDAYPIFPSGILSSSDSTAQQVLDLGKKISYWRNNRQRITTQMVVWLNKKEACTANICDEDSPIGVIIPKVVVCGTLTRRAMEATWLTASKTTQNRIGSELRSMIQAPPGFNFVGADVDSQELWIASLIGDSHYANVHGSTPLGWMTLSGTKNLGTDMHSVTAKAIGISREHAKIINYARIYGAGVRFAEKLIKQFNPSITITEAKLKASKMYAITKGKKEYKIKKSMLNCLLRKSPSAVSGLKIHDLSSAAKLAKLCGKKVEDVFERPKWVDGTESAMFNQLERIAGSLKPVTPFLQCRLSRALEPRFEGDDLYLNTRMNWVVQSGAVDFLHLMLVCMNWLTNGKARYCFSFHDEVRYLVPTEERYGCALAMHITNLLVRSFCAYRLGMYDLPQSVAFFSSVEVDKSLRKEANDDCVTPSNPHGIHRGYGIPPGESLNIYEAVEKSGGNLPFGTGKKRGLPASSTSRTPLSRTTEILGIEMSQATKRKHVHREVLQGELVPPKENQQIVRVLGSRGSNLHEVQTSESTTFLTSMPSKFRKNVWIKRGDYVLVEPIEEGGKVKAEIVNILTPDYIKFLKKENIWPQGFSEEAKQEEANDMKDDLFVNNNRKIIVSSENESLEDDKQS